MKLKRMSWLELGFAPVPVDIRKNMRSFSLKNPLEYKTIMDKYKIAVSNQNMMNFGLFVGDDCIFIFSCDLNEQYCYQITLFRYDCKITLYSDDGFIFKNPKIKHRNIQQKNYSKLLSSKEIQDILGIISFSDTRIEFKQQKENLK